MRDLRCLIALELGVTLIHYVTYRMVLVADLAPTKCIRDDYPVTLFCIERIQEQLSYLKQGIYFRYLVVC